MKKAPAKNEKEKGNQCKARLQNKNAMATSNSDTKKPNLANKMKKLKAAM